MALINDIIELVESKLNVPCLFSDWQRLNKETDKLSKSTSEQDYKFPAVYIIIPAQGTFDTRFGRIRETTQLYVNFVIETLERSDFEGLENNSRIEQMKSLAKRFIYHYNKSELFEALPDTIAFQNLYMITDSSLTGVSLTIQAKELIGECLEDVKIEEEDLELGASYYIDPETQELYMITDVDPNPITDVANFEINSDEISNLIKETEVEYIGADFELDSEGNLIVKI